MPPKIKPPSAVDTEVTFVCGRRRSGKSAWVKRRIAGMRRVLVWDYTGEYGREVSNMRAVGSRLDLIRILRRYKNARVAFFPRDPGHFDWFCRAALAWGNCTVVVEELASVTQPGKAPRAWGDVIRLSAHRQLTVIGITQRPAEIDKTIIGNASTIHYCPLARAQDVKYMADEMRLTVPELDGLRLCHWIERDTGSGAITRGKLPWAT